MLSKRVLKPVVKGLTWRVFAAVDTLAITAAVMWWHTGAIGPEVLTVVGGIVSAELFTKTALYTAHEKLWDRSFLRRIFDCTAE